MISVRVGGKLYWGGEYAVVEAGHTAVLMAVSRCLEAELEFSGSQGKIVSSLYPHCLYWSHIGGRLQMEYHDDYRLLIGAVELMSEYLTEQGLELRAFELRIDSALHTSGFQKYGLGSSGAVIVAAVRGILRLYQQKDEDLLVFKLACLILLKAGANGSMGDVASCAYGGLIAYTSFDREQVSGWLQDKRLLDIVAAQWKGLSIRRIVNRLAMDVLVGWTKQEASSSRLVRQVGLVRERPEYAEFLAESQVEVIRLIAAMEHGDKEDFKQAVRQLRQGLLRLERLCGAEIETEGLKAMAELAENYDAVGKLSGAGGGDCGLIFLFDKAQKDRVQQAMKDKNIYPLELE